MLACACAVSVRVADEQIRLERDAKADKSAGYLKSLAAGEQVGKANTHACRSAWVR